MISDYDTPSHRGHRGIHWFSRGLNASVCRVAVLTVLTTGLLAQAPAVPLPIRQIAYLKASNPDASDHFGCGGENHGHNGQSVRTEERRGGRGCGERG